jgi:hypothetical protein
MIGHRMRAFALSSAFAFLAFAQPAFASPYDGSWTVVLTIVINIGVAIAGGHISATSGKFVAHRIALNGQIWGSGKTKINGVAGPRQAVGIGRFTPVKGSGTWNGTGPSGVCSGVWAAARA